MDADLAIGLIRDELDRACEKFPPMHSNHEGYAVILEELDELWLAIKVHPGGPFSNSRRIEREAIQVGAMALRFLVDRCLYP